MFPLFIFFYTRERRNWQIQERSQMMLTVSLPRLCFAKDAFLSRRKAQCTPVHHSQVHVKLLVFCLDVGPVLINQSFQSTVLPVDI